MRLKENKPIVSVVVPVYNVEKYLRRCIDSLIRQDYSSYEIILVDDGSTDSSGVICDEYADTYDIISVIHKKNGGLSSARLAGFEVAAGELIVFADSDDYVADSYLRKLAAPFVDSDVQLSLCSYATESEKGIIDSRLPYKTDSISNRDINTCYLIPIVGASCTPGSINIPGFVWIRMYRTNLLEISDFVSEREYFTEDILMNILYAKRMTGNIAVINEPLYYYCVNIGSLTQKFRKNAFSMLMACNDYCRRLTADIDVDSNVITDRLNANLASVVTYSVYNAGRIRNYSLYKDELKKIFSHPDVKRLFEGGNWPTKATWHKIILTAYRFNLYFILYKLLKLRKT